MTEKLKNMNDDELVDWLTRFWCDAVRQGFLLEHINVNFPNRDEYAEIRGEILDLLKRM